MSKKTKTDPFGGKGRRSAGIVPKLSDAFVPKEEKYNRAPNAPGSALGLKKGKEIWPHGSR